MYTFAIFSEGTDLGEKSLILIVCMVSFPMHNKLYLHATGKQGE